MKINGSLVFDASSSSKIENLRIETVESLPSWTAADRGRLIYLMTTNIVYYGNDNGWVSIATGGNAAALQAEVDAIENSIGPSVNSNGTFNATAFSAPISGATSITNAINQLAAYATANNTLAELDDVQIGGPAGGSAPVTNDYLKFNGTAWVADALTLADVTDVNVPVAQLNLLNGLTATAAELNVLDGITGTTVADLNSIAGYAAQGVSATEFGYVNNVTSPIQTQLNNKQPLDASLTALAGIGDAPFGFVTLTATDAFAKRTLQAPVAGITISHPAGIAGDPSFELADDLAGLEGLTGFGYAVRTGTSTWTNRTITGAPGRIAISNGDGVATNTDVDLATLADSGAGTFLKITRDAYGRVSGTTAVVHGDITMLVDGTYVNTAGDTMTGNLDMGTNYVTMNNAPTLDTHAANKAYVDAVATGLSWKQAVRAASTGNVDIATDLENGDTLDGVTLATGDRVLLKNQTAPAENGIYVVVASGAASRSTDMNSAPEFAGATVFVTEGSVNADSGWTQTAEVVTVGTTAVTWVQFSGSSTYTWGTGLAITGNTVFVKLGAGIAELPTDEVGIDVVSNLALQLTGPNAGDQLTFVLAAGSGLSQSASGLTIAANGVTNAMLLNKGITFNGDTGSSNRDLGDTLIIAGTATQGIRTSVSGGTLTITADDASSSQKGVARFDAGDFTVTAGNVVIAAGGVDNTQLANSTLAFTGTDAMSDTVALGETLTFASAVSGLVSATVASNTVTLGVRLATTGNTGVASFNGDHFSVSSGEVSLNATLDDLMNVSSADAATAGDLLTKTAGDWQPVSRTALVGSVTLDDIGDVNASHVDGHVLVSNGTNWVNQKVYHLHTEGTATNTWLVTHNLGVQFCNVTVVDATNEVVIPQSITFNSTSQLTVTFNTAVAGRVVVMGIA